NEFSGPQAVLEGRPRNSHAHGWSPVASHYFELELAPGESKELIFLLGYVENKEEEKWESKGVINKKKALREIDRFDTHAKVERVMSERRANWDRMLGVFSVQYGGDQVEGLA